MAAEIRFPHHETDICRLDFVQAGGTWSVSKLVKVSQGQVPGYIRTVVVSFERKPQGFDIEKALRWCDGHGWTVRRWPGGARAWRDGLEPVRTTGAIKKLRDELRCRPRPELQGQGVALDLAYDL